MERVILSVSLRKKTDYEPGIIKMTRVKICGITNKEDARAAVDYGADALGFVLIPESPRLIDPRLAKDIRYTLPPFVQTVILVEDSEDDSESAYEARDAGFSALQFYVGERSLNDVWPLSFIRAFRIRDENSLTEIETYLEDTSPNAILLDTYHKDKLGGSGETFNWDLAIEAKKRFDLPIILAGGLTPDNVAEAVARVRPYAVDVSSGVESSPGVKDHAKLRAFIQAVRHADL